MTLATFDLQQVRLRVMSGNDLIRSPEMMKVARRLTIRPGSGMNTALNEYTLRAWAGIHLNVQAVFAEYQGEYIGWTLITREDDGMCFVAREGHTCIQVFVNPDYRRQGVGTLLMEMAVKTAGDRIIRIYEDDEPAFFQPFKQKYHHITRVY